VSVARLGLILSLAAASLLLGLTVFAANDQSPAGGRRVTDFHPLQQEGTPTPTVTAPSGGGPIAPQQEEEEEEEDGDAEQEQEGEGTPGGPTRVDVTNPDGKEMQLPCVSDVVRHPDKHPEWQVPQGQGCQPPQRPEVPEGAGNGNRAGQQGNGGGPQRMSMTNPDGKCVQLPVTAGPVRHRHRHPDWGEGCAQD